MGYRAEALFKDQNIESILEKLLYLKPQPGIDYFLSAQKGMLTVYPSSEKIAIGLTYEQGNETLDITDGDIEELRLKAESFFDDKQFRQSFLF